MNLDLVDMGSYFVGGRSLTIHGEPEKVVSLSGGLAGIPYDPNGHFWLEQAYVQYFVPRHRSFDLPLVLIHGGGLTGSTWESTPDGRPGWLSQFLEAGIAVHVIDNVERGRAGFCAFPGVWPDSPIVRSEEESWSLYRLGEASDYLSRTPFAGQKFPVQALDDLTRRTVPRWPSTAQAQRAALVGLVDRIGPCMLLGHSQGGGFAVEVAASRPLLVKAVVTLEPHGSFDTIATAPLEGTPLLAVLGDFIDQVPIWVDLEQKFSRVLRDWERAGGVSKVVKLEDEGMAGHSHMMMMDVGGEKILDYIVEWLASTVRRRKADS